MKLNLNEWVNPPKEYKGRPFWALNGKLEKEELKHQIECMKKMGFGGVFLHSRTGLITEYMSEEWMDLLNYCVEILNENGMDAWLYDEDRWPSGTCGGLVTKTKEFRAKSMVYDEIVDIYNYSEPENFLGLFAVEFDETGKYVCSYRKISHPSVKENNERVFVFYYIYMQPDSFYNGNTYLDTMNKDATMQFISLTHEKYKHYMGDKFGKEIVGIFTDEPHRGPLLYWFSRKEEKRKILIPYTYVLFSEFSKRKGYNIGDRLPVLWFGIHDEPFCKEMYDLVEILQELFLENFAKPYYEWCKNNNLVLTGHVLHEDNLVAQTTMSGSIMRYMEYMDYPGMDNLGKNNYCYNVPKLVSSVAKQLGKDFVLSELYGCTGWDTNFADYKHIGDWQSFGGVNFRCPHLAWYTMRGESKRDCPATINYQSAWWQDFCYVEEYFSRLQYLIKNGEDDTDIAIINPIESTWGLVNQYSHIDFFDTANEKYKQIQTEYLELYKQLWLSGINADYIDEGLFAKYGKIENGNFICGKKKYKTIILNGNYSIRSSTFSAIKEFINEGGKVIICGDLPQYLDGVKYDFSTDYNNVIKFEFEPNKVVKYLITDEVVANSDKIIMLKRGFDNGRVFLFLNSSNTEQINAVLKIKTDKECCCLNCRTGKIEPVKYTRKNDSIFINKVFDCSEELILLIKDNVRIQSDEIEVNEINVPNEFKFSLSEDNVFILDNPELYINGENFGQDYILAQDKKVRNHFNLELRHNEMIQPWYKDKFLGGTDKNYGRITLKYRFFVEDIPTEVKFMCEEDETLEIFFNGIKVSSTPQKTQYDNCYRSFDLPQNAIHCGQNEITVSFNFYEKTNLESMFLIGKFGVIGNSLLKLPDYLTYGDLCRQGLPCFGGKVTLSTHLPNGKYIAEIKDFSCALIKINGIVVAFPPYRCEFSVSNEMLEIELTMTRNNMFTTWLEDDERKNLHFQGLKAPIRFFKLT